MPLIVIPDAEKFDFEPRLHHLQSMLYLGCLKTPPSNLSKLSLLSPTCDASAARANEPQSQTTKNTESETVTRKIQISYHLPKIIVS